MYYDRSNAKVQFTYMNLRSIPRQDMEMINCLSTSNKHIFLLNIPLCGGLPTVHGAKS